MENNDTKIQNNKTIVIIVATFIIVIITIITSFIVVLKKSNSKPIENTQEQKDVYYYCYRSKEREAKCGDVPCEYTSYYKFKFINTEKDTDVLKQHVEGQYVSIYKFDDENFDKADTSKFIKEGTEYKVDAQSSSYIISKDMIIQPDLSVEFSVDNEFSYLNAQGFSECETRNE